MTGVTRPSSGALATSRVKVSCASWRRAESDPLHELHGGCGGTGAGRGRLQLQPQPGVVGDANNTNVERQASIALIVDRLQGVANSNSPPRLVIEIPPSYKKRVLAYVYRCPKAGIKAHIPS